MTTLSYQQQTYKRVHVETANPGRILLSLYDAAIRFVERAGEQIRAGDLGGKGQSLGRAHAIIAEFITALDHKRSPELCRNLENIYMFMIDQIMDANARVDTAPLEIVLKHLRTLRETWSQAVTQAAILEAAGTAQAVGAQGHG
jgi:flagellar secretion chaperone FliS